jgi:CBS domain-containing protein
LSTVGEVVRAANQYAYVHPDHPLSFALERMGTASVDVLPVVSRANIREMQGIVSLADVLAAYGVGK